VRLRTVNDPARIDVSAWLADGMVLAVEVKQLPVDEGVALDLAADAAAAGCDRALLVALDLRQPLLDRARIRNDSLARHGVLAEVATSVRELVGAVLLSAGVALVDVARQLQEDFDSRMLEIGLSDETRERWSHLCRGLN
jgi:hypothetical protein